MKNRFALILLLAALFLPWSLSGAWAASVDHAAINQAAVQTGDRLVSEFEQLTKQYDNLVASGADPAALGRARKALKAKALQISETYYAKLKLKKTQFKGLGARYHDLMKGADGKGGILAEVIKKAKKKLAHVYPPEVWKKIQLIQNQSSLAAKKAPMDVDAGILVTNKEEAKKIMEILGGPSGVEKFHKDLQNALESSYKQVAYSKYGVDVSPRRAYIEGTTIWHPEAYLDTEVLKAGGVAQRSLIQQTADVSKFKVNRMVKEVAEGHMPLGEALTEAARGTYKDLDKVERIFDEIARQTGVRPSWSPTQRRIKSVLDLVSRGKLDPIKANSMIKKLTGGQHDLFGACNALIDKMEEAVRQAPSPRILKARFFKNYLSGDDLRKALRSLVEKDLDHLPQAAKLLDRKLAEVAGVYMVSLQKMEPEQFLAQLRRQMKGMTFKSGDEAVEYILKHIYTSPHQANVVFFGPKTADVLERVRKLTDPAIKKKVAGRFLGNHIPLRNVDKNARKYIQLGEAGSGMKAMALDAIVGTAMAIYQTGAIMDQNLSPEEENRQIMNAWVTALPMVGDFAQAIIDGIDAYYEGSKGKAIQAGIFLTIGAAYAVPGLQVPAVVASLGMVAWQLGSSAWDVYKDKAIIWAWVDSGKWDRNQGRMLGLVDAKNNVRPVPPDPDAFKQLVQKGDVGYHSGLSGTTISESVCDYAERTILAHDKNFEISKLAIHNLYPKFDLDKNLPLHINAARVALAVHIRDHGGNPRRDLAMALFVKLKKDIYDKAVEEALKHLKAEAEAEYQAKYMVGEAAQVFQDLQALAARLHLPLVEHVNVIYESFLRWSFENIKSPWVRHSIPRRHVDLARRYLKGYLAIEKSLEEIKELFEKAGLRPPKKFNLTGYLEIDSKRIEDLVRAYQGALGQAHRDALAIYRQVTGSTGYMDMKDPCNLALFQKLANIQVRLVFVRDFMLLLDQWMGKKSAAEKSRDEALQQALDSVNRNQPILVAVWQKLSSSYEEAYSWANMKWEGSPVMAGTRELLVKRIEKMKKEYEAAKAQGAKELADCAGKVLVHLLRRDPQGGPESPISGAVVGIKGQGVDEVLIESSKKGDYTTPRPAPGQYTITAQADGYKALDGKPEATASLNIPQPAPGQPVKPAELTIYMQAVNQPKLEVKFTKASAGSKPKLELTITSPQDDLKPDSLLVELEGKVITCQVSGSGKSLSASYEFDAPLSPGKHQVKVKVTDVKDIDYELKGDFTYVISLTLTGYTVDDKGGRPEDKRPNSGETVKLALKLKSFEPGPLKDLVLVCPTSDPRLTPVSNDKWTVPSLMPGQETVSPALEFKVGEVKPPHEAVALALKGTLEGKPLSQALNLEVTVYPGFLFKLEMEDKVSDPKTQGTPNNGDGKAQAGESIGLVFKITNLSDKPSPAYRVELACSSDLLVLGEKEIKGAPLQGKQTIKVKVPAKVSTQVTKGVTVTIKAHFLPEGDTKGKVFSLPLRLEPPPLKIKILGVKVEDPKSGSLTTRNDGNGRLGSGEYAYLTIQLVNESSIDLGSMHFDLKGPGPPLVTINKPSATVAGVAMPSRRPVSVKFELDLSPDYSKTTLKLGIKGREAIIQSTWEGSFTLPVDVKTLIKSEMKLYKKDGSPAQPGDLSPGSSVAWKLILTSQAQKELKDLALGLSSTSVRLVPNQFSLASLAQGGKKEYQGTLSIPAGFKKDSFVVRLDVTDASGSKTLHRNRFEFKLGGEATKIVMKPQAPPQGQKDWKVALKVQTTSGKPVDAGQVTLKTNEGQLSADKLDMASGSASFTWTPPQGFSAQALIELAYSGDEVDPAKPDRKYLPSTADLILPPNLGAATRVEIRPQIVNRGPNWWLTVEVVDDKGAYVKEGVLEVSLNLGSLSGSGVSGTSGQVPLKGGPLVFTWTSPGGGPRGQGKVVFSYLGDQADPNKPDLKYAPSRAEMDLPPLEKPTIRVTPGLIDKDKGIWRLDVLLTDSQNRPIGLDAVLEFTADGGTFEAGTTLLKAEKTLKNGACIKGWQQTDQDQHIITVRYPGDRKGPGGSNLRYQAAETRLKLPPNLIARSTIFVVDASGSMAGGKLAQAKAAVRAALGGIPSDQTDEEFALIVFAGCGNVRVYQGFTTNPRLIIRRLTFRAGGGTPIAQAMGVAAAYMRRAGRGQTGRIILLSDGGESCRGKPVEAAKSIHRSVRSVTPGGARSGGRP